MRALRVAAAVLSLAAAAAAQDGPPPDSPGPELPPAELTEEELLIERRGTVTTAGRRPQSVSRSSAATTVVTAQEIRESGAQRLTQVLRTVAGVNVTRLGVDDAMVNIRGLNTPGHSALMLLIDGRPAQVEFFGVTLWDHLPVPLEMVERIEVVRGPASPTYGANAFSGVVNVITKDPRSAEGAEAMLGAGTHAWTRARGMVGMHGERGGMWLTAGFDQSEGWDNDVNPAWLQANDPIVLSQRDPGDLQWQDFTTTWRGAFEPAEHLTLRGDAGYMRSGNITFLSADTTFLVENADHAYLRLGAEYSTEEFGSFEVRGWVRHDSLPTRTWYATLTTPFQLDDTIGNQVLDFEAVRTVRPFEGNVLTYGGGFRLAWLTGDEIFGDDERTTVGSLWVQDEYRLHETLDVTLSLRWDDHTASGSHLSPRAAVVWAPTERETFRLSAGRAFRNPTNVQNFASVTIPTNPPPAAPPGTPASVQLTGNPDLNAETQTAVQFDWSTNAVPGVLFEASVFYALLEDLILFSPPPAPAPNYVNVGDTEIAGGEVSIQGKLLPWLRGFANYGLIWASGDFEGLSPKHQGSAGLRASGWKGFSAAATANVVGAANYRGSADLPERHTDAYAVLTGRLAYTYERAEFAVTGAGMAGADRQWPRGDDVAWQVLVTLRYRF